MSVLAGIDLAEIFGLSMPALELVLRGSAIYWFLFAIFRLLIRRDVGSVGIADLLIVVLVADAAQNGMAGEYKSVTDGIVLISTLVAWNMLLDWLSFRFRIFRRLLEPQPLRLVKDGQLLLRNMRREFISEDELWAQLRQEGVDRLDQVKAVYLEADGNFSVIRKED